MYKAVMYGLRPDEVPLLQKELEELRGRGQELEIITTPEYLTKDNTSLAEGADAVLIVAACKITEEVAEGLHRAGVRYILTRSTGFDQISKEAIRKFGIRAANVPVYSTNAVPEFTVLLMLSLVRKWKTMEKKLSHQDFTLQGVQGKELGSMTLGLFGTGKLGIKTAEILHAMGCTILASSPHEKEEAKPYVTYTTQDEVFRKADLLFFHCVLNDATRQMVNRESIAKMKNGVYLVNTARGGLVDFEAVLDGLKSGKIAGFASDVYDKEAPFIRKDLTGEKLEDPVLAELLSREDVILTPHVAFFTETSVSNLIRLSLESLIEFETTGTCEREVYRT
ncbi:d-lactate dehydrogenase [Firmicutes bacterium CAG:791]|nr:d-lactate dehydrogenase [Firmicutes bacterium CAG:791]